LVRHANPWGLQGADAAAIALLEKSIAADHRHGNHPRVEVPGLGGPWQTSRDSRWDAINGYNLLRLGFNVYIDPDGKVLSSTGTLVNDGATLVYRARKYDCDACELKPRCCPKTHSHKVTRSIHEEAREIARSDDYVMRVQ
jgi:hypothetical protein